MVKCDRCGKSVERANRVVVETRAHQHPEREYHIKKEKFYDKGGPGTQIVREENVCSGCLGGE